jgi:soluble lytic murein transglycosylase-like protein
VARAPLQRLSGRRRGALAILVALVGLGVVLALATAGGLLGGHADGIDVPPGPPGTGSIDDVAGFDPFAFEDADPEELIERGRDGYSHPLYAFSPGGATASAARVARFRPRIDAAAERHDVDPATLEALVMLESAGRPDVAAGDDPDGAVGLGQILPETATGLLGMSVDLAASKRLTRAIDRGERRARRARSSRARRAAATRVARLERRRRSVDERYDPDRSLDGAARYLALAERRLGREDLAVASYHMGIGNLEDVIEAYIAPARPGRTPRATVERHDVSYARLLYDSSPVENRRAHALLAGFGDDSRSYLLRVEAAREILRLHRDDPRELARLERLHALWPSGELVLRPPEETESLRDAEALGEAYEDGELVPLPDDPERLGFTLDPELGAARRPEDDAGLYRGLRPEGVAALLYMTKEIKRVAGQAGLTVTDAVRDEAYGRRLARAGGAPGEPPRAFSPHSSGFSFDVAREYPSRRVGRAFASALERLRALRVIDYVYEPDEIHVTAGPDAERLVELQETLVPAPG